VGRVSGREVGRTWVVDAGEKERLVDYLTTERDRAAATLAGPVGVFIAGAGVVGDLISGDGYDPGPADQVHDEFGVGGSASVEAGSGTMNGGAGVDAAIALGAARNVADGSFTVYYKVSGEGVMGVAQAPGVTGVSATGGASAEGPGEMVVAVTFDGDENPVRVAVGTQVVGGWEAEEL